MNIVIHIYIATCFIIANIWIASSVKEPVVKLICATISLIFAGCLLHEVKL